MDTQKTEKKMIKITFEIEKDLIEKGTNAKSLFSKLMEQKDPLRAIIELAACKMLSKHTDKGVNEFTVLRDNLDDPLREVYDLEIGKIIFIAANSIKPNYKEEQE